MVSKDYGAKINIETYLEEYYGGKYVLVDEEKYVTVTAYIERLPSRDFCYIKRYGHRIDIREILGFSGYHNLGRNMLDIGALVAEELDKLTPQALKLYVDVTDYEPGSYYVSVNSATDAFVTVVPSCPVSSPASESGISSSTLPVPSSTTMASTASSIAIPIVPWLTVTKASVAEFTDWTLLEPLLTMIVLTIVFGTILQKKTPHFSVYILTGRLLYSYFSTGTKQALKSIRRNGGMIRKVYVPKYMYPLAASLSSYSVHIKPSTEFRYFSLISFFTSSVSKN